VLGFKAEGGLLDRFLQPVLGAADHGTHGPSEVVLLVISVGLAVAAVAARVVDLGISPRELASVPERQPELAGWLANAFYINTLYAWLVAGAGKELRPSARDDR